MGVAILAIGIYVIADPTLSQFTKLSNVNLSQVTCWFNVILLFKFFRSFNIYLNLSFK